MSSERLDTVKHDPAILSASLGELISIQSGYAFKSEDYTSAGHFLMRIGNVQDCEICLDNPKHVALDKRTTPFELSEGDILTSLTGNIGRVARIEKSHLPAALNQRVARLTVKDHAKLDDEYLYHALSAPDFRQKLTFDGGGAAQQNVSPKAIAGISIPLPPLDEQRRIAEVLRSVDEAIAAADRTVEATRAVRQVTLDAMMQRVLNDPKLDRRSLSQIANLSLGKMLDKKKNKGELRSYLANINVRWGSFDLQDLREMRFEGRELERYSLRSGDIVMCEGGEPGRCALWTGEVPAMMIQKALHRIRPTEEIESQYLYYALVQRGRSGGFNDHMTGGGIKHLTGVRLSKVEVPIPPLNEQRRIAEVLRAMDDAIAAAHVALERQIKTKRALQSDLLSGHVRVPA